ncbi:MAG TPA: bifunctional glutamate N-acetyltransferase/amino-acid acetyltransferase ArgJ, partial [Thermaerobacter sp.]
LHCGIKRRKPDLGWIVADEPCVAAGVYTQNRVHAPCVDLTRAAIQRASRLQAVVCNSGNANVCTPRAATDAAEIQARAAALLGIPAGLVAVAQTGVIGEPLPMDAVRQGLARLPAVTSREGGDAFAEAILTTDTHAKQWGAECVLEEGCVVRIGAAAKGSGMIHPQMATMLAFITTDAAVEPGALQALLREATERTFNAITVDGDTSTNDMVIALASGRVAPGGTALAPGRSGWDRFAGAFEAVCDRLARAIAADGEGATRMITVVVEGAPDEAAARQVARTVAGSPLVKTAVHGADANWGRILAAVGRSGLPVDPARVDIDLGPLAVCRGGLGVPYDEAEASAYLRGAEVEITIRLGMGEARARAYGCDLSPEYVRINASYRT